MIPQAIFPYTVPLFASSMDFHTLPVSRCAPNNSNVQRNPHYTPRIIIIVLPLSMFGAVFPGAARGTVWLFLVFPSLYILNFPFSQFSFFDFPNFPFCCTFDSFCKSHCKIHVVCYHGLCTWFPHTSVTAMWRPVTISPVLPSELWGVLPLCPPQTKTTTVFTHTYRKHV